MTITNNQTPAERLDETLNAFRSVIINQPMSATLEEWNRLWKEWDKSQEDTKQTIIALIDELMGEVIGDGYFDVTHIDSRGESFSGKTRTTDTNRQMLIEEQNQRRKAIIEQLKGVPSEKVS